MAKAHIFLTTEPLDFGGCEETEARCGAKVSHPVPESMVEYPTRGMWDWNSLRDCAKCFALAKADAERSKDRVYLYLIRNGQEAITEEP